MRRLYHPTDFGVTSRNHDRTHLRYVAYSGVEDIVDSDDNLTLLLALLQRDGAPLEDVAVWEDDTRLVAVVLGNRKIVLFEEGKVICG